MKSLDRGFLEQQAIPIEMGGMIQALGEWDIERVCPSVSRDMIRVVLNRLRQEGKLHCKGTGRNAVWEKRGNGSDRHGNKYGNT